MRPDLSSEGVVLVPGVSIEWFPGITIKLLGIESVGAHFSVIFDCPFVLEPEHRLTFEFPEGSRPPAKIVVEDGLQESDSRNTVYPAPGEKSTRLLVCAGLPSQGKTEGYLLAVRCATDMSGVWLTAVRPPDGKWTVRAHMDFDDRDL
jgi:hypothetical protein